MVKKVIWLDTARENTAAHSRAISSHITFSPIKQYICMSLTKLPCYRLTYSDIWLFFTFKPQRYTQNTLQLASMNIKTHKFVPHMELLNGTSQTFKVLYTKPHVDTCMWLVIDHQTGSHILWLAHDQFGIMNNIWSHSQNPQTNIHAQCKGSFLAHLPQSLFTQCVTTLIIPVSEYYCTDSVDLNQHN